MYSCIYIYTCYPPKDLPFLFFFVIFAFAESIGRLTEKKKRPWHGGKEIRSFCKYSSQTILQGKVCQRLDLEGTDLVRTSTRTTLEGRSKK